jgi:LPS sulfotransferase NodH
LGEILYFAGGLGCPLEYFHSGFRPGFEQRWQVCGADAYLKTLIRLRTDPSGVFSIKLFWQDVAALALDRDASHFAGIETRPAADTPDQVYRDIFAMLRAMLPNPTCVYLRRADRVRQAVSVVVATQSGIWRDIPANPTGLIPAPVDYDHDAVARAIGFGLHCHAHWKRFFAVNSLTPHNLTYEEMADHLDAAVARLFAFLGRPVPPPYVRIRRQSNSESERMVLRYLKASCLLQPDIGGDG